MSSRREETIAKIITERIRQFNLPGVEYDVNNTPSQLPLPEGRGLEEKMLTTSDQPGRKAID
jgi:hypothetical protein